jgi:hypothetical protein
MDLLETIWRDNFLSLLAAVMLCMIMAAGFWFYMGPDYWAGVSLLVIGSSFFVLMIYVRYVVLTDPKASITMHFLGHVQERYLYVGFVVGMVIGWVAGSLAMLLRMYRQ